MQVSIAKSDTLSHSISVSSASSIPECYYLPILCLCLISIVFLIAAFLFFKNSSKIEKASSLDQNFMNRIRDYVHDGKIEAAHSLCKSTDNPAGRIVDKGLGRIGNSVNDLYFSMENLGKTECYKIEKGIPVLLSFVAIVIVLGLMGSLLALTDSLKAISPVWASFSLKSISLLSIESGLLAGLIIFLAYRNLRGKIECFRFSIQKLIGEFMDLLNEPAKY